MPCSYAAYGLHVRSSEAIPGLSACETEAAADVEIHFGAIPRHAADESTERWHHTANLVICRLKSAGHFHFRYADGTEFLVEGGGHRVWCDRPAAVSAAESAIYVRGPILGMVLRLCGTVCLHASSVAIGSSAIALVGSAGAGKSTTAAGFLTLGFRVLADDVVALRREGDRLMVLPGPSRVSLWPDAGARLFGPGSLPRVTPADGLSAWWDKRYVDVDSADQFQRTPLPLSGVYILGDRTPGTGDPLIDALGPKDAFLELTEDTYVNYALDEAMRAREFGVLGHIVRTVPVRHALRFDDPARVVDLCRAILEDHAASCTRFTTTGK